MRVQGTGGVLVWASGAGLDLRACFMSALSSGHLEGNPEAGSQLLRASGCRLLAASWMSAAHVVLCRVTPCWAQAPVPTSEGISCMTQEVSLSESCLL